MARRSRSNSSFVCRDLVQGPANFVATKRLRSNSFFVDKELAESGRAQEFANELRQKWLKINRNRRLSLGYSPNKNVRKSSMEGFESKKSDLKNVSSLFLYIFYSLLGGMFVL